jgi:NAD(P)-dependent dehydrogenase (short-subunit alcohol dehydrogenase family)
MPFDLTGKTALITGASSGLGRHFAQVLARSGCAVAIAGRRRERLEAVQREILALGQRCVPVTLDVTVTLTLATAIDQAEASLGPIDILVNNAGMNVQGRATDLDPSSLDQILNTNLRAPFLLATEMARRMIARGKGGRIINIASIGAFRVLAGLSAYCMSKAGVAMMTQCLAREWARYGINVNAICPGYIATELNQDWFESEAGKAQVKSFPRRQLMREEDLDEVLLLLASDSSSAVTGALFSVDDGQSL